MGLLIIALALGSCVSKKKFTALEQEKASLASSLENLEEKVEMLEESNVELNAERDELSQKVGMVEDQLKTTKDEVATVSKSVEEKQGQINMLRDEIQGAFADVEQAVSKSGQRITELEDMLYLDLEDPINFSTGSAKLSSEDEKTLEDLAEMLKGAPSMNLIIEGHTDDRPINNAKYSDNWDLSVARSVSIVRELIDLGVDPKQLTAAGKGEFHPRVTDDPESDESRSANRRTEVIVVPKIGKLYQTSKSGT